MNKTLARNYARAWSGDGRDAVVIFEAGRFSWERVNAAIPAEIIYERYHDGFCVEKATAMNKTLREIVIWGDASREDAVTVINQDIDRLMARLPALPAWAAHQICGWDWLAKTTPESRVSYIKEARAESKYSHSEEAHNR